jgi:hypothetical protein
MRVKVIEATGPALDWMVAKAAPGKHGNPCFAVGSRGGRYVYQTEGLREAGIHYSPSTNPAQAWPIIEREGIQLSGWSSRRQASTYWSKSVGGGPKKYWSMPGSTGLIAAMRCFVASELGEEVDVPEELLA